MRILYLSQKDININGSGIYSDLINGLRERGHEVVLCCADSSYEKTQLVQSPLKKVEIKVANQFGVNIIKKGLIILSLEKIITKAIKKYLSDEKFDLVLYATPPITLANVVKYCKKKYGCRSYLMLKDIFPQNAVDLNMMSTGGLTGILYKLFRSKEIKLYKYSDAIGCMSKANIEYLKKHNPYLGDDKKIELFPNAVDIRGLSPEKNNDRSILQKYGIADNKTVFIYGGNLGKPQGLDFFAEALKSCSDIEDAFFVIIGNGGEKEKLFKAVGDLKNVMTMDALPKDDYEKFCSQCDVGMVMLDKRFTIPNYPSRTLSYLSGSMPIMACTDKNTDINELVENQAKCGKWCYSGDVEGFRQTVLWFLSHKGELKEMGQNGFRYLIDNFNIQDNIEKLEKFVQKEGDKQ